MNIKLQISEVVRLISNRVPMEQVCKQLTPLAKQAKIGFPAPQTGAGYLQWSLQGDGWMAFSKAKAEQKAVVAKIYQERCESMLATLKTSPLKDIIFTVPSDDFIYFRENGMDYEISLVAWGFKFPNQSPCIELSTWVGKSASQKVCIGFEWDGNLLKNCDFKLENLKRKTSDDGWFYVDGWLPVGKEYQIKINSDIVFTLKVEQGKEEYIYDLTRYVYVDINVRKDNAAMANCACEVNFNGTRHQLETNEAGCASLKLALVCTLTGEILQPQPVCQVTCKSEVQEQIPLNADERLIFNFVVKQQLPPEPISTPEPVSNPEPHTNITSPSVPPVLPSVEPDPQFVEIKLLDFGGSPMANLDFTLVTKKKARVKLKTDANGICSIPQEWFTNKEKFQVKVEITPEYQKTHDIHNVKN